MWPRFLCSKTNVFSVTPLDCRWTLSFSVLALPSGCERTICLIAGDVRARSQLGCAQIICYAASPHPLFSLPFFNISACLSSFLSPPSPSCLLVEVVIHQTATSVRCQLALMNDSDERMLNERGKWESGVIIIKDPFSAKCCLLYILHRVWG